MASDACPSTAITVRQAHVPCVLLQYTVLDVIDKLTTVTGSSFHARVGRLTVEQDVGVEQATMAILGYGSIVEKTLSSNAIRSRLLLDARQSR
jgi:hypothetical protein